MSTETPTPTPTLTSTPTATATPTVIAAITSTASAQCFGSSCHGYYANSKGCEVDAASYDFTYVYDTESINIGEVHFRHSDACFSQWAQVVNLTENSFYAENSIRWGYIDYSSGMRAENGQLYGSNDTLYTLMYGVDGSTYPPALVCGSASVSTPVTSPALTPPINLNSPYGSNNCIAR